MRCRHASQTRVGPCLLKACRLCCRCWGGAGLCGASNNTGSCQHVQLVLSGIGAPHVRHARLCFRSSPPSLCPCQEHVLSLQTSCGVHSHCASLARHMLATTVCPLDMIHS